MSAREWLRRRLLEYREVFRKPAPIGDHIVHYVFSSYGNLADSNEVSARITALNGFYRANVLDVDKMGDHIAALARTRNLSSLLEKGDDRAIELIRSGHGIRKKRASADENFYVFATKFAIWHELAKQNIDSPTVTQFAMFDSRVETALTNLSPTIRAWAGDSDARVLDSLEDIRNLPNQKLRDILDLLQRTVGVSELDRYKGIDEALWALGYDIEASASRRYFEDVPAWLLQGKVPHD